MSVKDVEPWTREVFCRHCSANYEDGMQARCAACQASIDARCNPTMSRYEFDARTLAPLCSQCGRNMVLVEETCEGYLFPWREVLRRRQWSCQQCKATAETGGKGRRGC